MQQPTRHKQAQWRPFLTLSLILALVANVVFIAGYLWSRDGQTTVVEIAARQGVYRVSIDGQPVLPHVGSDGVAIDSPGSGTVRLRIPPELASLPDPNGVDSIVIRDTSGRELFRDDFDFFNPIWWEVLEGEVTVTDGVLGTDNVLTANSVQLRDMSWSDMVVAVTYKNSRGGTIGLHITESGGVYYHFDLIRDFANFIDAYKDGQSSGTPYGGLIQTSAGESFKSIVNMLTRPYPYVLAALLAGLAVRIALGRSGIRWRPRWRLPELPAKLDVRWPVLLATGLAVAAFAVTLLINSEYYSFLPHAPDEVAYLFQGELLANFRVTTVIPPEREAFYFYAPNFLYENGTQWAAVYPFGHPLVLAIGAVFGAPWLMPSVVGAGNVFFTYLVGRRLYGIVTGLIAAAVLAMSPFFLMQSSNFMSHGTAALYVLSSFYFLVNRDRPMVHGFLAGALFGLAVNTRPLGAIALVPAFGLVVLLAFRKSEQKAWLQHTGAFLVGGFVIALAMFAYNYGITGDPLVSAYGDNANADPIGFTAGHTLDIGLRNELAQLMALLMVLNGWPVVIGLGFVALPFLLGTSNRWDYILLLCALLLTAAYVLYRFSGVFGGPRYWFEAAPFLVLLTVRGAEVLGVLLDRAAHYFRRGLDATPLTGQFLTLAVLLGLALYGSGSWLFGWNGPADAPMIPMQASSIEGMFEIDDRLHKLAEENDDLEDALVLVEPCGYFQSIHCYGTVFLRNLPDFDGDVVWARYVKGQNQRIISAFLGRDVYVASWDPEAALRRFDPSRDQ